MDKKDLILKRLIEIGESLKQTGDAKALLGLGSIGMELERFDEWSDLDFFVIVKDGKKKRFIDNIDWLTNIGKPAFFFLNSPDGYKYLYEDGVYCEFAIFEEHELSEVTFSAGRVVWKTDDFNEELCKPSKKNTPWKPDNLDWAMGEVLTCLYVGLCRFGRGEKLIAAKFVQTFALDILVASASYFEKEVSYFKDDFQNERRFEIRFPDFASKMPDMMQGYDKVPESALAILNYLESKYNVNAGIRKAIVELAERVRVQ
ncbi:MAG TPA: hypothetical protein DDY71_15690 [Spirochaetia bacterium]|nr:MAG: hypothetical protein A2Y29_04795 [Spirochaetes bacterium GWE2_31_10]HBD94756.1 hypothetical protein [Spirochaetia bacterium]HBI39084.1 hypothetical protein [Spirochaetia bacterium]